MTVLNKEIIILLRRNARFCVSSFSRKKGVSVKKAHYEFSKVRNNVDKFVSIIDFEALGFSRVLVFFLDAVEGLAFSSMVDSFFINNSVRLDTGLFVEYVFFSDEEKSNFLKSLRNKKIGFEFFPVESVIKQESFLS